MVSSVSNSSSASSGATGSTNKNNLSDVASMQERFLKLLVAQINSQDPLNPMDNAQMTSQMAQINTVSGIQQVNESLTGLASQFTSMQVLQASSLVGRDVLLPGNALVRSASGSQTSGTFMLDAAADKVKIEIVSASGTVLDTLDVGKLSAGRHAFDWDASKYPSGALSFRVSASAGNTSVKATAYTSERVQAVGLSNGVLTLDLKSGQSVPYSSITAVF